MSDSPIKIWTRVDLARHQIDVAIRLLLDEHDFVSCTTLAGAAEEILGMTLRSEGKVPALDDFIDASVSAGRAIYGEDLDRSTLAGLMNYARNGLKHIGDGSDIAISRDVAVQMLDRAIANYWSLRANQTPQMQRFVDECLSG